MWRLAFGLALCATLWLALEPSSGAGPWFWQADKLQHAAAFAVLAWLGARARVGGRWALVLGLLAFGAGIEIAQSFTATRTASALDLAADAAGIALALVWERRRGSGRLPEEDGGQVARE
jgi:VanZ family protein